MSEGGSDEHERGASKPTRDVTAAAVKGRSLQISWSFLEVEPISGTFRGTVKRHSHGKWPKVEQAKCKC
jgi:hypothetical protein